MRSTEEAKPTAKRKNTSKLLPGLSVKDGYTIHPFDAEFGVKTSGLVAGRHLKSGHKHDRHVTAYYGVAPSVFAALIKRWQRSRPAGSCAKTTFVDLGAGMGRALMLASQFPFKAVVGVELHPTLAKTAQKNLGLWRASRPDCPPMQLIVGDALEFTLPRGPVVIFLFNPFRAPVLRRLLQRWRLDRSAGDIVTDLIYVNNEHEGVLESEPHWRRTFLGKVRRSKIDAIADHRIMANQPEGEYAASNWEDCSIWHYQR